MKALVLIVAALLAGTAVAESELEVRVNRIDMAVTAPEPTEDEAKTTDANPGTKAQDYNSSRSNTTSGIDVDSDDDGIDEQVCSDSVDEDCDAPRKTAPANHNTTRSNRLTN